MRFIIVAVLFAGICFGDNPCNKWNAGAGYVCVCNSTYCDTISSPNRLPNGQFHVYYSGNDYPGFNHEIGQFNVKGTISYGLKYEVDTSKTFQTIRGFGASFSDSFGYSFNKLSEGSQDKLISSFFSEDGLEYTVCRVCLGSSDFSLREYTYAPNYDPTLKYFNLTNDDHLYKIPQIQRALKVTRRPLSLLGTTWSPPTWMKVNNLISSDFLKEEFRQVWANYHIKILDAFRKEGIEFWGFTTGNEPITLYQFPADILIPDLAMFPEEQRDWVVGNLGPTLRNANYSTKIILMDDQRTYALWWMNTVLRNELAKKYVHGIGLHWYFDKMCSPTIMDEIQEKYPKQEILYTESSVNTLINTVHNFGDSSKKTISKGLSRFDPTPPVLGVWKRAKLYISNIIENLSHWVTTYIDWNLGLDLNGGPNLINMSCDASVIVNKTADEFYKQPMFYAMGHFSKFFQPQSIRISVQKVNEFPPIGPTPPTGSTPPQPQSIPTQSPVVDVEYIGALNPDGSKTIIFHNTQNTQVEVMFHDPNRGRASLILRPQSITSTIYW